MSKFFVALFIMLECILRNNFDSATKLFSNLYLDKFLDILVKSFFSYTISVS